jgi:hypothetical protein
MVDEARDAHHAHRRDAMSPAIWPALRTLRHCHRLLRRFRRAARGFRPEPDRAAGRVRRAPPACVRCGPAHCEAARRARWAEALPPVQVVDASSVAWSLPLRLPLSMRRLRWRLSDEQGREQGGEADAGSLPETAPEVDGVVLCERVLPMSLALETGYHRCASKACPARRWSLPRPAAATGRPPCATAAASGGRRCSCTACARRATGASATSATSTR